MSRRRSLVTNMTIAILILQTLIVLNLFGSDVAGADYGNIDEWTVVGRDEYMTVEGTRDIVIGESMAAGDLDGNGRDDIIVGAPDFSGNEGSGAVLIYFDRDLDDIFPLSGTRDADVVLFGEETDDWFGTNIASGDMNGDGRDELLVSATGADGSNDLRRGTGEVYIIAGRQRSEFPSVMYVSDTTLYGHIYGKDAGDRIGKRMVLGDLNGDGLEDLSLGTDASGGYGGTNEYEAGSENSAPGSWEIEIIEGDPSSVGELDLRIDPRMVRYLSSYNTSGVFPGMGANHAMGIGTGMEIMDMDGDGYNDLIFSFTRWVYQTPMRTDISVISGGPSFPHIAYNSAVDVIIPSFSPNLTINLNDTVLEPPMLAGGDLDGDAFEDLAIGGFAASGYTESRYDAGRTWILRGFDHDEGDTLYESSFDTTIFGEDSSDGLGTSLMCADVDGDTLDELFIGAPEADGVRNLHPSCGEGYRFEIDGSFPSSLNVTDSEDRYMGIRSDMRSFSRMEEMSINEDDKMEFLVSSPGYTSEDGTIEKGLVSMFMERQEFESRFFGGGESSSFGEHILTDDFNNDGYEDIMIADSRAYWTNEGGAYLYFGGPSGFDPIYDDITEADIEYRLLTFPSQANYGAAITSGDVNNDGFNDIIIGAPDRYDGSNNCGSTSIIWGGTTSYMESKDYVEILGMSVEGFGESVCTGDFNDDGITDLAVGSSNTLAYQSMSRFHAGKVDIIFGPITSGGRINVLSDTVIYGSIAKEYIGMSLASGDMDGDSADDIIIGAPKSDLGSITDQGLTYIVKGRTSWPGSYDLSSDPSIRIFGAWPYDQSGSTLATGEVDGDDMSELAIGCPNGGGFQRTTPRGGNAFIIYGKYIASMGTWGNISLRDGYNITVFGEADLERLGSSLAFGDMNGDGLDDLVIGAKGWKDDLSGIRPGAVMILQSGFMGQGSMLNSSSLPMISTKQDGDLAGSSVYLSNTTGDANMDILMGAPGHDPRADGSAPGGVFLWRGQDLNYRDIEVSTARIDSDLLAEDPMGLRGSMYYLSPGERTYIMKVSARSTAGYEDIETIEAKIYPARGSGTSTFIFDRETGSVLQDADGVLDGKIRLNAENSSWRTDELENWYIDFGFEVDWGMPPIDKIVTSVHGISGQHYNYLSREFGVDSTIQVDDDHMEIDGYNGTDVSGWLRNDSSFTVSNITLSHSMNGERIENALDQIELGLFRPDGIAIGRSEINGSTLMIGPTMPGDGLAGDNTIFRIAPLEDDPLPEGSVWIMDAEFPLKVDTLRPPEVSSFTVFPDGQEEGLMDMDDDRFVEVRWQTIFDAGPSGIQRFVLTLMDNRTGEKEIIQPIESGDLVDMGEGDHMIGLHAVDRAGNTGPILWKGHLVDTTSPRFHGAYPENDAWLTSEENRLTIMVSDNGSGIDTSSASYRIFRADSGLLTGWKNILGWERDENGTKLVAPVPNAEGYGHYVQWRISDATGQESVSGPLGFNIDKTPPMIDPDMTDVVIGEGKFTFTAYVEDQLSWLDLTTLEFKLGRTGDFQTSTWRNLGMDGYRVSASASMEVDPAFEGYGYAQWRARDRAGNLAEGELITVLVDRTVPEFHGFIPNGSTIQTRRSVEMTALITEELSGMDPVDVEISYSRISDWVRYGVGGFSPWEPVDDLQGSPGSYQAVHTVMLDEGKFNQVRFRARDRAENGWVISTPVSVEVDLEEVDLPPEALFTVISASDMIFSGEYITLDASASFDPEGENLTYFWYSDLEEYPGSGLLGTGERANVTLTAVGVHNIWLVVSEGTNEVQSEKTRIRVVDTEDQDQDGSGDEDQDLTDNIGNVLLFLILSLLIGAVIGALMVYLVISRREIEERRPEPPRMVDAHYEPEYRTPYCPYCGEEARPSDEYCIKCGTVFTEKDKKEMLKGKKPSKKRKRGKRRRTLASADEDRDDLYEREDIDAPEEDWDLDEEEEEDLEEDFFAEEPSEDYDDEDEFEDEEMELMDLEEIDDDEIQEIEEMEMDLEDLEEDEEDEVEWEVEE